MANNHRDKIRMSDQEQTAFIEEKKSLQVATLNADGSPHLSTLWFALVDNKIVFETYTRSQKIVNLHRDPRITVLVEDGLEYQNLRGVMIQGPATLHEDQEAVQGFAREVVLRNEPEVPAELVDQVAARMAAKRTAVVIEPTKTISWDHTKLG